MAAASQSRDQRTAHHAASRGASEAAGEVPAHETDEGAPTPEAISAAPASGGGDVRPASAPVPSAAASAPGGSPTQPTATHAIGPRPAQFMIASRQVAGLQPLSNDAVAQSLRDAPGVEVIKTINPPTALGLQSIDVGGTPTLVIARMAHERAKLLQAQGGPRVVVEHDAPVTFGLDTGPVDIALRNPGVIVPLGDGFQTAIQVNGPDGPLADAEIYVFGSMLPAQGKTDATGCATINVVGESPDTIRALYAKPQAGFWDMWLTSPRLIPNAINTLTAKPLSALLKDFPDQQLLGWGQRAMGLDQVPANYDGAGIKVAIIDSGAAQPTHRNLHHLGPGVSVVGDNKTAWTNDTVGHGSHCAGIIAGSPVGTGGGIRGFAPAAEVHILRIFPGARFSDLVSALDYCVENGIDVINMSLGGGEPSQIVEDRLIKAKELGVACIVAAGNSGGPVQFPASTPHALSVAAIGKWGEFPSDSFHTTQVLQGFTGTDGYFPAKFSCFGPEIDVCAPGVAIVSSLPPNDFGAWDGTSMACPHVTGLATLVLAHHPDFRGAFQARDARRVERLFQIIKDTATPLQIADATRVGAGLPNVLRALGLPGVETQGLPTGAQPPAGDAATEILRRLIEILSRPRGTASAPRPQNVMNVSAPGEPFRNQDVTHGPARTLSAVSAFGPARANGGLGLQSAPPPGVGEVRELLRQAGLL